MPLTDEESALEATRTLETLSDDQTSALHAINTIIHNGEPFVDVHELFRHYDILYFRCLLSDRVEVLWSPRLTLCAGICELSKDPTTGKFTRIRLKLSTPLLQYRPRTDTINTLLHEAIHAYFFVTTSWRHSRGDDGTGHGVGFQLLADAINNHGGTYEITVYHTFHDEVDSYRTHVWQCEGPCRQRPPFFGLVKRSMNRAPGKSDTWWAAHEADCGGTYTKIQEPELTKKQRDALSKKERAGMQKNKLDAWVKVEGKKKDVTSKGLDKPVDSSGKGETAASKVGTKRKAETIVIDDVVAGVDSKRFKPDAEEKDDDNELKKAVVVLVDCPICIQRVAESEINQHLDTVHPP